MTCTCQSIFASEGGSCQPVQRLLATVGGPGSEIRPLEPCQKQLRTKASLPGGEVARALLVTAASGGLEACSSGPQHPDALPRLFALSAAAATGCYCGSGQLRIRRLTTPDDRKPACNGASNMQEPIDGAHSWAASPVDAPCVAAAATHADCHGSKQHSASSSGERTVPQCNPLHLNSPLRTSRNPCAACDDRHHTTPSESKHPCECCRAVACTCGCGAAGPPGHECKGHARWCAKPPAACSPPPPGPANAAHAAASAAAAAAAVAQRTGEANGFTQLQPAATAAHRAAETGRPSPPPSCPSSGALDPPCGLESAASSSVCHALNLKRQELSSTHAGTFDFARTLASAQECCPFDSSTTGGMDRASDEADTCVTHEELDIGIRRTTGKLHRSGGADDGAAYGRRPPAGGSVHSHSSMHSARASLVGSGSLPAPESGPRSPHSPAAVSAAVPVPAPPPRAAAAASPSAAGPQLAVSVGTPATYRDARPRGPAGIATATRALSASLSDRAASTFNVGRAASVGPSLGSTPGGGAAAAAVTKGDLAPTPSRSGLFAPLFFSRSSTGADRGSSAASSPKGAVAAAAAAASFARASAPPTSSIHAVGTSGVVHSSADEQALRMISCTLRASDIKRRPGARPGRVCTPEELSRRLLAEAGGAATKLMLTRAAAGTADLPPPAPKPPRGACATIAEDEGVASDRATPYNGGRASRCQPACGCVVM